MDDPKTPGEFIRTNIFKVETQKAFADLIGCTQAEISRFENEERPISTRVQKLIREKAAELGIPWDNNWFFEVPQVKHEDMLGNEAPCCQSGKDLRLSADHYKAA